MFDKSLSAPTREFWSIIIILIVTIIAIAGAVYWATLKVAPAPVQSPLQQLTTPTGVVPDPKNVQITPVMSDWSAKLPDGTTVYRIQDKEMNRVCYVTGAGSQLQCGAVSLTITAPVGSASE